MSKNIIQTHILDATGQTIGRLSTQIAKLLMGKHKTIYVPNQDNGDAVMIKNITQMKIWPKKLKQKKYYRYSGYPGGLKAEALGDLLAKNPTKVLLHTVAQMLPKNKLRKGMLKRLTIEAIK